MMDELSDYLFYMEDIHIPIVTMIIKRFKVNRTSRNLFGVHGKEVKHHKKNLFP
jgi:hypothetical protein